MRGILGVAWRAFLVPKSGISNDFYVRFDIPGLQDFSPIKKNDGSKGLYEYVPLLFYVPSLRTDGPGGYPDTSTEKVQGFF